MGRARYGVSEFEVHPELFDNAAALIPAGDTYYLAPSPDLEAVRLRRHSASGHSGISFPDRRRRPCSARVDSDARRRPGHRRPRASAHVDPQGGDRGHTTCIPRAGRKTDGFGRRRPPGVCNLLFFAAGAGVVRLLGGWRTPPGSPTLFGVCYLAGVAVFGVTLQLLLVLGASFNRWLVIAVCVALAISRSRWRGTQPIRSALAPRVPRYLSAGRGGCHHRCCSYGHRPVVSAARSLGCVGAVDRQGPLTRCIFGGLEEDVLRPPRPIAPGTMTTHSSCRRSRPLTSPSCSGSIHAQSTSSSGSSTQASCWHSSNSFVDVFERCSSGRSCSSWHSLRRCTCRLPQRLRTFPVAVFFARGRRVRVALGR